MTTQARIGTGAVRALAALAVMGSLASTVAVASAGPLDAPALSAPPAAILAAARQLTPGDAPVTYLRDDVTVSYDSAGRIERRYRMVIVVHDQDGIDDWGTLAIEWQPSHQDRPQLRARVIGPTGAVTLLDPTTAIDGPAMMSATGVASARRQLAVALPALTLGAVIEEEVIVRDREPLLAAGTTEVVGFWREQPIVRRVVTIAAPSAGALHVAAYGPAPIPVAKRSVRAGRTTWVYDLGPLPADDVPVLSGAPDDHEPVPVIAISTGASWAAVAAGYRQQVEAQLRAPVALPAGLAPGVDRAAVDRIVAWLHAHVDDTGLRLDHGALGPALPAETLRRGAGDAEDRAALLVALLRSAGLTAELALLSFGPGPDLRPGQPGLGGLDHVLVRARVGGRDLWIDPGEDALPAGQLPIGAQGRRALVIAAGTRDLVPTPRSVAADNTVREVRTYALSEQLYADVTEVTRETGVYASNLRTAFRDRGPGFEPSLRDYAHGEYQGTLVSFTGTDPRDLATPFALTVAVADSHYANAERDEIHVQLQGADVLERMPAVVTRAEGDLAATARPRTVDYVWDVPHVYEIEHRLEVPPGHGLPALVASERRALGTVTFTASRRVDGRTVVITHRLDTGKPRLTAAELRATRAAVQAFLAESAEHVILPDLGVALRLQGQSRAAIAEHQRMIALHPREAIHHQQLALTYLALGQGPAARRAAARAVAVEPTASDAHAVRGYVLSHDLVGRPAGVGADRAGAIAAYRAALRLYPEHLGALEQLAELLALDDRGRPSFDPAALRAAIDLRRQLVALSDDGSEHELLAVMLARAGELVEAEQIAKAAPPSPRRSAILVWAATARGVPAALAVASSLATGADHLALLNNTLGLLLVNRQYPALRGIVDELRRLGATAPPLPYDRLVRRDDRPADPADPGAVAIAVMAAVAGIEPATRPWSAEVDADVVAAAAHTAGSAAGKDARLLPPPLARDLYAANLKLTVAGDAGDGWTVTVDNGGPSAILYLARLGPRVELVGAIDLPSGIVRAMVAALARGDRVAATRWIERLAPSAATATEPHLQALAALYRAELAHRPGQPLSTAALEVLIGLLGVERLPAVALPLLRRCPLEREVVRVECRRALLLGLERGGGWTEAVAVAGALVAAQPGDANLARRHAHALAQAGQRAAGEAIVDAQLVRQPDDLRTLRLRAYLARAGGGAAAQPWFTRILAHPGATLDDLNNVAWTYLYDATPAAALAVAERAETVAGADLPGHVANTLAAILAESDQPDRAWTYLQRSIATSPQVPPADADWYIVGRIAETYGLRDDAIAAYRRIKPTTGPPFLPTAHDFARRNLARLGAKP